MHTQNRWLLPEGVEEVLPPEAMRLECLCRKAIDLYVSWGYELVIPPMIEYLESLLTGTGEDLDLQTCKITDQLSGRMMGVHADTTPQVARIDAHILKREVPTRLCYLSPVLRTKPALLEGGRSPLQLGAELYGHTGIASDIEVLSLMLETLQLAGVEAIHIDIGHVGIYRSLINQSGLDPSQQEQVFSVLQKKSTGELVQMLAEWQADKRIADALIQLTRLNGDRSVLQQAKEVIGDSTRDIPRFIEELEQLSDGIKYVDTVALHYDLGELRGYYYHTGIVFTAYHLELGEGIAFGGRYDNIGEAFGRQRAATGFSINVKKIFSLSREVGDPKDVIFAPYCKSKGLAQKIRSLREAGKIVICELPDQTGTAREMQCTAVLEERRGEWQLVRLTEDK